ncbi:MAG: alpha/beta fold hydrolase [Gammaproteobacteria bacterium]
MTAATIRTDYVPGTPRLAYDHAGSGAAVVFLHGIGGNADNWHRQLAMLADGYHAVAWDARGYGNSDDYAGALDFADFAADLLRLLDHLGCARAHLCGLSMGGRIALDFHDRHPARVASLVLVDTFPGYDAAFTQEGRERFVRERRQPLLEGKALADIAPAVAASLVSPHASPAVTQQLVDSMCKLHKVSYLKTIEAMTMYQPVSDVAQIRVPVQVIVGADDRLTPPRVAQKMAAAIPDARLLVLADTGHLSNLERPDEFDACLRGFLDSLD